jgi:hypothetical protein
MGLEDTIIMLLRHILGTIRARKMGATQVLARFWISQTPFMKSGNAPVWQNATLIRLEAGYELQARILIVCMHAQSLHQPSWSMCGPRQYLVKRDDAGVEGVEAILR